MAPKKSNKTPSTLHIENVDPYASLKLWMVQKGLGHPDGKNFSVNIFEIVQMLKEVHDVLKTPFRVQEGTVPAPKYSPQSEEMPDEN